MKTFPDILEHEDCAAKIRIKARTQVRHQKREIAAQQPAFGAARDPGAQWMVVWIWERADAPRRGEQAPEMFFRIRVRFAPEFNARQRA